MGFLTKEQIKSVRDCEPIVVSVPEWGGDVRLAPMGADVRDWFDHRLTQFSKGEFSTLRAPMVAACLVDESGIPVFNTAEVEELGKKNATVVQRLFEECLKLNKMDKGDKDKAKGE